MKLSTRELATIAVFGTLWGLSEISLGSVLKSLNVPFSGAVLSAIGLTIALVGRLFVPKKGSTLFIGVIAMLLKLFSLGGVIIGPMVGIIAEALVAEIVLSLLGKPRLFSFLLAGAFGVAWTLVQPFITGPLLFGRSLFVVWLDLLDTGSRMLGLKENAVLWIVIALLAIYLFIGGLAGWLGWNIAKQLQTRLGRSQSDDLEAKSNTIVEEKRNLE
jgi:ABC-type thiamin/hydroxymethylpyrimidine transport system permease subunit